MYLSEGEMLYRLVYAAVLGAIFGRERKYRQKPIGTRTHILISLAACAVAIISSVGFGETLLAYPETMSVRTDPARFMVGMLTGIGFIGAGIIYKSPDGDIRGVTTAAVVYLVAVLGIGVGLGLFVLSTFTAIIAYIALICSEHQLCYVKEQLCKLRDRFKSK